MEGKARILDLFEDILLSLLLSGETENYHRITRQLVQGSKPVDFAMDKRLGRDQ